MNIQPLHPNFLLPTRGTDHAGAFDLYMPTDGHIPEMTLEPIKVKLGFAAEIPQGYVALLLPRSGAGSRGLELQNTTGVIDADYRGEWIAFMNMKNGDEMSWKAGSRLLQMLLVPAYTPVLNLVDSLSDTARGDGGFGSSGA